MGFGDFVNDTMTGKNLLGKTMEVLVPSSVMAKVLGVKVTQWMHDSGDPKTLDKAGNDWIALGETLHKWFVQDTAGDNTNLQGRIGSILRVVDGRWEGPAYLEFRNALTTFSETMKNLPAKFKAIGQTLKAMATVFREIKSWIGKYMLSAACDAASKSNIPGLSQAGDVVKSSLGDKLNKSANVVKLYKGEYRFAELGDDGTVYRQASPVKNYAGKKRGDKELEGYERVENIDPSGEYWVDRSRK